MSRRDKATALLFLGLALIGSGAMPIFLRYMLKPREGGGLGLDPWIVNTLRYSMAPVFWLPFVMARMKGDKPRGGAPSVLPETHLRRPIWTAAIVPAALNLVSQYCWGAVGRYADANMIGFISKLNFPFTVLYSFFLFPGERRLAKTFIFRVAAAGALAGLVLLSEEKLAGPASSDTTPFGFFLLLLLAVSWAGYSVSVKKRMSAYSAVFSFWVISIYTTAGLVLLMFLFGDFSGFRALDAHACAVLVASSFVGITFWHVLYYRAIKGVGAVVSDGVIMVSPFLTVVGSAFLLGETLTVLQAIGGVVLVGAGILLVVAHGRVTGDAVVIPEA